MTLYVADTHALFWYLINSPALGSDASRAFDEADNGATLIYLPAIVLAELYYLNEKQGRPLDFAAEFARLSAGSQFVLLPFMPEDTLAFDADRAVPEMHDRMIAGAARRLGASVITRDQQITASGLAPVIW